MPAKGFTKKGTPRQRAPGAGPKCNPAKLLEKAYLEEMLPVPGDDAAEKMPLVGHAVARIHQLMYSEDPGASVRACKVVMDRAWGMPKQSVTIEGGNLEETLSRQIDLDAATWITKKREAAALNGHANGEAGHG